MKHLAISINDFNKLEISKEIKNVLKKAMFETNIELDESEYDNSPKLVGKLNKSWGIIGFNTAEIGHPVYEISDRYIIYLSNEKVSKHEVRFYKETLRPAIDLD